MNKNHSDLELYQKNLEKLIQERTRQLINKIRDLEYEIKEQKKLEANLIKSKIILNSIGDGVITIDENNKITSLNKATEKITGYNGDEAIGKSYNDIFEVVKYGSNTDISIEKGKKLSIPKTYIKTKKGELVPISLNLTLIEQSKSNSFEYAIAFQDISQIENLRIENVKENIFQGMVSSSPKMLEIFSTLPDIAVSESSVLIEGPTGTGKELLAKAIHTLSNRNNKPFIIINCGAIPENLMESELFGYLKGSFTDAKTNKQGKILAANGGTVFFDEIGELPLNLQVKLLRLLDNYEIDQIGSTNSIKVNVRVITATNRNLSEMVENSKFREDLFYRLNTVKLYLPGLNERKEDIPILIEYFIKKYNLKTDKNIIEITPEALKILIDHTFSGNVRELEKIIEYSFIMSKNQYISVDNLPKEIIFQSKNHIAENKSFLDVNQWNEQKKMKAKEEKEKIIFLLNKYNGNKTKTCKDLNINYSTLFRKLKKYNLS